MKLIGMERYVDIDNEPLANKIYNVLINLFLGTFIIGVFYRKG
jgi:hypothetical protein